MEALDISDLISSPAGLAIKGALIAALCLPPLRMGRLPLTQLRHSFVSISSGESSRSRCSPSLGITRRMAR